MLSSSERKQIIKEYEQRNNDVKNKVIKVLRIIALFFFAGGLFIIFLFGWQKNIEVQIVSSIVISIGLTLLGVGYLVDKLFYSKKATYEVLLPALIAKINFYEEKDLSYQPFNKQRKTINKEAQLFTKGASVTVNGTINGKNNENEAWSMHDLRIIVSTGQSSSVLFDGFLFELTRKNKVAYQIRTAYSPPRKPIFFSP